MSLVTGWGIAVKGLDDVLQYFEDVGEEAEEATTSALERGAELVVQTAKQNAPRRTGALADNIKADISSDGLTATVGSDLDYARYVEYGTRHMEAQPFLEPALDVNRSEIIDGFKDGLKRAVKE